MAALAGSVPRGRNFEIAGKMGYFACRSGLPAVKGAPDGRQIGHLPDNYAK
jgi:hypothetical protein